MKTKLTAIIIALTAGFAFGHGDIELGPNKGLILEFSTNETMHGEVTDKNGKPFKFKAPYGNPSPPRRASLSRFFFEPHRRNVCLEPLTNGP